MFECKCVKTALPVYAISALSAATHSKTGPAIESAGSHFGGLTAVFANAVNFALEQSDTRAVREIYLMPND